jgi:cytochrome c oxidase subunit 2
VVTLHPAVSRGLALPLLGISACSGPQSALETASRDAERVAHLFWWMTIGSALIWLLVVMLAVYSTYVAPTRHDVKPARLLIVGGGVVLPSVVLVVLLSYGLAMLPDLLAPAPEGSLRIRVSGEQWWWRVRYLPAKDDPVDLANEIRLPVGEPVEFELESPDVIHSFWIPSLGGKVDMIPGRKTRLRLEPTRPGVFRGVCAEYCGTSHALMAFAVIVQEPHEFAAWLETQAKPAAEPSDPLAAQGRAVFLQNGCGACHTIRGTVADGVVGPDLTHVGGRRSLGAGTVPNGTDEFRQWIARTDVVKPGVHMPAFGMLPERDLRALAAYLESLQ